MGGNKKPGALLLFLFVLLNGNNPILRLFYILPASLSYIIWIIVFLLITKNINYKISRNFVVSFFIFSIYLLFSLNYYGNQNIGRIIQLLANISLALLVVNHYKATLIENIEIILKFICRYSLSVWGVIIFLKIVLGFNLFYSIPSFLLFPDNEIVDINTHAIFFNFRGFEGLGHISIFRNPGFFWEPGALSGTIIMLYMILFINKKNRKNFDKLFFLVSITVFSTLSIGGITTVVLISIFKLLKKEKGLRWFSFNSSIAAILIILSLGYLYSSESDLKRKFDWQFSQVQEQRTGWESNRLGTAIFILNVLETDELDLGVGLFTSFDTVMKKLSLAGYESEHAIGNGFFLLMLQLGIYLCLIFFILLFRQLHKYYKELLTSFFVLMILIFQLQGEVWSNYPLFFLFLFLNILVTQNKVGEKKLSHSGI